MIESIVCPTRCSVCDGDGYVCREEPKGTTYYPTCDECGGIGSVFGHVACGWAFDAGMREAEVDAVRSLWLGGRDAVAAAVADERERFKEWGRALILSQIEEANAASAAPRGGQTVGPSNNPWTRVPPSARIAITREMRDLFEHIESGAPAPREG